MTMRTLGVIIAGGLSTRFGSAKALAEVGGVRVIDRVAAALRAPLGHEHIIAIVNDTELATRIGMPHIPDDRPGAGALSGLHAGLLHAQRSGFDAVFAAGCDMPFLSAELIRELVERGAGRDAMLPASEGPRGVEPLCAWYATSCIEHIEAAVDRGDARMIGFHRDIDVGILPMERVRLHGDPARLFMNLNTPADLERAERCA